MKMIKSYIPRVAAVNDLSGFGKVSLTEAIPIMSAMGVEVCPLPTSVLSTHTYKFTDYTFLDMTEEMRRIIAHWQSLGLRFAQLRFTTESASECVRVLRAYQSETVEAPENITRGLFYRGAE